MARGFIAGLFTGIVVLGAGASAVSVMTPMAPMPDVSADAPRDTGQGPVAGARGGDETGPGRDADLVEAAPTAPETGASPEGRQPLDPSATQPASVPEVGGATDGLGRPQAPDQAAGLDAVRENPVRPPAPAGNPEAPQGSEELSISVDPAQPPAPDVNADAGAGLGTPPAEDSAPDMNTAQDQAPVQPASGTETSAPEGDTSPEPETESAAVPEVMDEATPEAVDTEQPETATRTPEPTPAPGSTAVPDVSEAADPGAAPAADTDSAAPEEGDEPTRIAALPQAGAGETAEEARPRIGKPVVPLTERGQTEEAVAAQTPAAPPIKAYAQPFQNPEEKPLMAIVLIDDEQSLGTEALREFPYPLSFAVDPTLPDAAERMARHREAGFEVVALFDLPLQASPQDAEVALAAGLDLLPETVAVLEGPGSGFQGNRGLSDQVTAIARDSGRGLITQDNGLNTVHKLALRDGVPAAVVFRDFDGAGQSPTVMRRFLDQAAFRARQEGAVIMLGRVRPDTVSALLLWGLQDRATQVALAPVSAVLTAGAE